jgi:2-dehydro-3-deoxygluconokinase
MTLDDRLRAVRDAVAVGECMLEFSARPDGSYALGYAGDTYNVAVYLARSTPDVGVSYLSAVGSDRLSDAMLAAMAEHRIDTTGIWRHPTRTVGLYLISTDGTGERSFTYYRSEAAARECFGGDFPTALADRVAQADLVYLSGISLSVLRPDGRRQLYEELDRARAAGALVVFDTNYRPVGWPSRTAARAEVETLADRCDLALPTLADDQELFGVTTADACAAWYAERGVSEVVVKLGERGCLIRQGDGREETVPADRVDRVVDTTAAGDSFNGRYLAERITGRDPVSAARRAHRTAGHVIGHRGAIAPPETMASAQEPGPA